MNQNTNLYVGIGAAVVLSLFAIVLAVGKGPEAVPSSSNVGGERASTEFTDFIKVNGETIRYASGKFAPTDVYACWTNNTGVPVIADEPAFGWYSGTASSSFKGFVFGTTTNVIAQKMMSSTFFSDQFLIPGHLWATSTPAETSLATTTSAGGVSSNGTIVAAGSSVCFYLQAVDAAGCSIAAATMCEAASSSNKGFTPFWKLRYHY